MEGHVAAADRSRLLSIQRDALWIAGCLRRTALLCGTPPPPHAAGGDIPVGTAAGKQFRDISRLCLSAHGMATRQAVAANGRGICLLAAPRRGNGRGGVRQGCHEPRTAETRDGRGGVQPHPLAASPPYPSPKERGKGVRLYFYWYALGDIPYFLVKQRVKYFGSLKPTRKAISEMLRLPTFSLRMRRARSRR